MIAEISSTSSARAVSSAPLFSSGKFAIIVAATALGAVVVFLSLPLLVSVGVWFLGMAVTLIAGAFIRNIGREETDWLPALIGQALGVLGLALLVFSSLTTF